MVEEMTSPTCERHVRINVFLGVTAALNRLVKLQLYSTIPVSTFAVGFKQSKQAARLHARIAFTGGRLLLL